MSPTTSGSTRLAPARARSRRLGRASALSAGGTVLSRVTGLLRLVVIAYALGTSNLANAFNLSNNTPNMIHDLVLGGVLSATFVPVFVERLANTTFKEAQESISAVVSVAGVVLVVATVLFVLAAPAIIDLYTFGLRDVAERAVAVELLRLFAPQLLFYGAISLIGAVLYSRDRFASVGIVPVINNVAGIFVLLSFAALAHTASAATIEAHQGLLVWLGLGTTFAVALQAAALLPALRHSGIRLRFRFRPRDRAVGMIIEMSGWTFGFVVANQVALFIMMALAAHLNAVSVYTYAFTFFQFPFAIAATSIIAIATPQIARAYARSDRAQIGAHFGRAGAQVLTVILPAMIGYLLLAKTAMQLVLRHGHLSSAGATLTAQVLVVLALGLPGFCIFFLATRTLQSMRDPRTTFVLYVFENGLNVALAFALYHPLGVRGLALSYTIAYSAAAIGSVFLLRKRLGTIGGRGVLRASGRAFALSIAMGLVVALVSALIGTGSGFGGWIRLIVIIGAGIGTYLMGAGLAAAASSARASNARRADDDAHVVVPMSNYLKGPRANRSRDRQLLRPPRSVFRARGRHLRAPRHPPRR